MRSDPAIDTLLDLHGETIDQEGGYWMKIEAWRVDATEEIPHGIRYSLTLHDPYGKRILGYDNAHLVKPTASQAAEEIQICWAHYGLRPQASARIRQRRAL